MIINYNLIDNNIDVTDICVNKLCKNNIITIPESDFSRAVYFGDPLRGILKSVFITNELNETIEYEHSKIIYIDTVNNIITYTDTNNIIKKLDSIHKKLNFNFGSLNDEYPEQIMTTTYLTGNENVLEIGANIGRNTLVIASILKEKNNTNFWGRFESIERN